MSPPSMTDAAQRLCAQAGVLLGWRPDDFWNATPADLATALSALSMAAGDAADASVSRSVLNQLQEQFPDG